MSGALRPSRYREPVKPLATTQRDVEPFRTALRDAPPRGSRPLFTGGYPGADHRRVLSRIAPAGQWLYPFSSVGGPNNQYLQLILAALAAKASGRTLLLAPFVKWGHNPGTFAKNFSSTFDAGALARFVPVQSLEAPRAFSFSAVSQVVTAGFAPSTDNFRNLCYAAGLPCNGDALRASATGFGSEALARCKGTVKSDGSYMRCLLSKWADRSTLGFSAWGFGKVKVRAPLHEGGRRTAAPA